MEKGTRDTSPRRGPNSPPRRDTTCLSLAAITFGILFFGSLPNIGFWNVWPEKSSSSPSSSSSTSSSSSSPTHSTTSNYDPNNPWETISPSPDLEWHPCYPAVPSQNGFLCARLSLPMAYNDIEDDDNHSKHTASQVHLALILLSGSADQSSSTTTSINQSKPPIITNPGGPGGSGVQLTLLLGSAMQSVFGPDQPVLGFDPRGVAFSTPRADCWAQRPTSCPSPLSTTDTKSFPGKDKKRCPEDFAAGLMHRIEFENAQAAYGFVNDSDVSLRYLNGGQRAVNRMCREKVEREEDRDEILRYAGTRYTARDMVGILDAWDRWVEKQQQLEQQQQQEEQLKQKQKQGENETPKKMEKGKLTYWGFSYGTYLGMTFARMFPDRVGRMILDGVVDSDYYEREFWAESLLDADKGWDKFFDYCFEAKERCAFWKKGDGGVETLRKRYYEDVLGGLDSEEGPVTFTHPVHHYPVVLKKNLVRLLVFGALKAPVLAFPAIAELLKILAERRYEDLSVLFGDLQLLCLLPENPVLKMVSDAQRAIMCADKDEKHRMNLTVPQIKNAFGKMAKISQFADIWVYLMLQCNGWDISEPYKLEPDVEKQWTEASNRQTQVNTSFPILFLGNTYDPVTPLKAAVKMSLRFKGAGLIELEAGGHCTAAVASLCVARAVRDYVHHGKVPPPAEVDGDSYLKGKWTKCEADEKPWKILGSVGATYQNKDDVKLMEAFKKVQEVVGSLDHFESALLSTREPQISRQSFMSKFGGV